MKEKLQLNGTNASFTQYPNKLRKESENISPIAKLCFVIIMFEKKRSSVENFTPSYSYMKKHYDINSKVWKASLDELENLGYISVKVVSVRPRKISITIDNRFYDGKSFSMFPNAILLTDVYTNNQKIFIGAIIGEFVRDFRIANARISLNSYNIFKKLVGIDFKKSYIYKTLNELSDPKSGYLNIFGKDGSGYFLDFSVLLAIGNRVHESLYTMNKNGTYERKGYVPPVKGQFLYSNETLSIVEDTSVVKTKDVKKKLSGRDLLALEEEEMRQEEIQKAIDYAYQTEEMETFIKENGL